MPLLDDALMIYDVTPIFFICRCQDVDDEIHFA